MFPPKKSGAMPPPKLAIAIGVPKPGADKSAAKPATGHDEQGGDDYSGDQSSPDKVASNANEIANAVPSFAAFLKDMCEFVRGGQGGSDSDQGDYGDNGGY